ncbi:lysophospholipid acyltransferase family protein [Actinoplanes sp. NPDC051346]|uniref:lysophospholipid acyltransferase family protein n=1 Tax=Actinoplanes sp. NPDC051346 TaxID=3155048 RepID=UPI003439BE34
MSWQPVSSCGPRCRPGGDEAVSGVATVLRLGAAAAVLIGGLVLVPLLRGRAIRTVARGLLAALGVRLVWRGRTPHTGSLLVANHVSWLDVLALLAVAPVTLVAKREVRGWPLVGAMARAAGAIFVDRDRPRRLPETVAEVAAALRAGRSVAAFPEGTTFSVRRVAALRGLTVTLVGSPALRPEPGADRRFLARAAQVSAGIRATTFDLAA